MHKAVLLSRGALHFFGVKVNIAIPTAAYLLQPFIVAVFLFYS
jgi:hypothetical protein